ncbi:MAG TPA: hypothetical protein VL122_08675 [Nitrospirota bacterium]|nr:hypothetical protein [Nitrospirota bacterium]
MDARKTVLGILAHFHSEGLLILGGRGRSLPHTGRTSPADLSAPVLLKMAIASGKKGRRSGGKIRPT